MFKTLIFTAALVGAATSANAVANLLVNPGFETYTNGYGIKPAASTDVGGWTVQGAGTVYLAGPADWLAYEGDTSILLSGGTAGAIGQLVDVIEGKLYELSFAYAANPNIGTPGRPAFGIVSFGEDNQGITFIRSAGQSAANVGWVTVTDFFVAPRTGQVLVSFNAVADDPRFAVAIDALSLTVVPEPATWALLIAGFGMVGFSMRRRRSGVTSVTN